MSKFKVIAISLMAIFLLSANHGFSAENVHPHHVALFVGGAYNTEAEIDKGTAQSKLFLLLGWITNTDYLLSNIYLVSQC